jgi:chaperonin GroES
MAAETGVIVALGDDAFLWNGDRTRKWEGVKPKVGDRVYIQRYAGQVMLGEDSEFYRIMDANCIAAVKTNKPFIVGGSK